MMDTVKLDRHGMITLPKALREKHGLQGGDEVTIINLGNQIILLPRPRDTIEALKRIQVDTGKTVADVKAEALEAAMRDASENREQRPPV